MIDNTNLGVLNNHGGPEKNSLVHMLQTDDDDEEPTLFENSVYLNYENVVDVLKTKRSSLKVLSLNCQSLFAKYDQLCVYIQSLQELDCHFDVICLQETWLDDSCDINALNIEGYEMINKYKTCSSHGGLAIFLKNGIQYRTLLSDVNNFSNWEHLFIEILIDERTNSKLILGNVYRLPRETNADYDTFMDELSQILENFNHNQNNLALFGDYNIDLLKIKEKAKVNEFFEFMISKSLIAKITFPTRFSRNSATLIDNAFCKISPNLSKIFSGILTANISDHQPYMVSFDHLNIHTSKQKLVKIQDFSENSIANFKAKMLSYNFNNLLNSEVNSNPDASYCKFNDLIHELKDEFFPTKVVRFNKYRHKGNKWITRGIMNSIKFRDKLYTKLKMTPLDSPLRETLHINLNTYNNILKKNIRLAKSQYYHNVFERFKKDVKNTWKTIKELISRTENKKLLPDFFRIEGQNISNDKVIANKFNEYFNEIGPSLARNIDSPNVAFSSYLTNETGQNLHLQPVAEDAIAKIIDKLPPKTSRGVDGLSMKFVKEIKDCILSPLCIIINQMLITGIFPNKLKIAKIVPVYKKDDNRAIQNYRPISVLPVFSKIFEKVILIQLNAHLKSSNIMYESQYGFREGHSTEFAAMENIDKVIESLENKGIPLNIFLDLSKAFDTLDHNILLHKLKIYGINGNAYRLCESYLTNRQQYVEYNGYNSELLTIQTGVPQGSILGPVFFLIYVNDFARSTNMFRFIMYADDTTLLATLSSTQDNDRVSFEQTVNCELQKVSNWLKVNKLSINVAKTQFMFFHPKNKKIPDINLLFDNEPIVRVSTFDFLGIKIDENMTWNSHLFKIRMKISKVIGIMNRLKCYLPSETLLVIYNSLILPHLLYGILLWGLKSNKLSKLQKRAIRIITKSKHNAHTDPLLKKCNMLKIKDIFQIEEWKFYFKFKNGSLPQYFMQFALPRQQDVHTHATRTSHLLTIPHVKYEFSKSSIKYRLPKLVNDTPHNILSKINTHSLQGFKFYLKRTFINSYHEICTIPNCYVCTS